MKKKIIFCIIILFFFFNFFSFSVYSNIFISEVGANTDNSSLEFVELFLNSTIIDNETFIVISDSKYYDNISLKDIFLLEEKNNNFTLTPINFFLNYSFIILSSSIIISEYPLKVLEKYSVKNDSDNNESFKVLTVFLNSKIGNGLSNNNDAVKIFFYNKNFSYNKSFFYNNTVFNKSFNYDFFNNSYFVYSFNPGKILIDKNENNNYTNNNYNNTSFTFKNVFFMKTVKYNIILNNTTNNNNTSNTNNTNNTNSINNTNNNNTFYNSYCQYDNITIILEDKVFEDKIKFKIKNNTYKNSSLKQKYFYYYYFTDVDENNITIIKKSNTNYYKSFTPKSLEKDNIFFLKVYYYDPCNKNNIIFKEKIVLFKNKEYNENLDYKKLLETKKVLEEKNKVYEEEIKSLKQLLEEKEKSIKEYDLKNKKFFFIKSFYTRQKYVKENNTLFYTLKENSKENNIIKNEDNIMNVSYKLYYCNLNFLEKIDFKKFNNSYYKNSFSTKNVSNLYLFLIEEKNNSNNDSGKNNIRIYYYKSFKNKLFLKNESLKNKVELEEKNTEKTKKIKEEKKETIEEQKENKKMEGKSFNSKKNITSSITSYIIRQKNNDKKVFSDYIIKYSFVTIVFVILSYLLIKNYKKIG